MPLDPQAAAYLQQLAATGAPPYTSLSAQEARRAHAARAVLQGPPPPVTDVEDRTIPGPGGTLLLRLYRPQGAAPFPALVYFHGGGWVIGSIETHDNLCRQLTRAAGCIVVSVDYRLAPEHRFPAAAEDAYAATCWVAEHARELGLSPDSLAVGGDSAGGNLAAVAALMARDRGGPALAHQLLIYPVTGSDFDTASYEENATGYGLTREGMVWFWDHYLPPDGGDRRDPYAAPLYAPDLRGLPPAMVITAEFDPLRDEGQAYAERLRQAGVPVVSRCYPGMIHSFFPLGAVLDRAREAVADAGAGLRAAFASSAARA